MKNRVITHGAIGTGISNYNKEKRWDESLFSNGLSSIRYACMCSDYNIYRNVIVNN